MCPVNCRPPPLHSAVSEPPRSLQQEAAGQPFSALPYTRDWQGRAAASLLRITRGDASRRADARPALLPLGKQLPLERTSATRLSKGKDHRQGLQLHKSCPCCGHGHACTAGGRLLPAAPPGDLLECASRGKPALFSQLCRCPKHSTNNRTRASESERVPKAGFHIPCCASLRNPLQPCARKGAVPCLHSLV